MIVGDSILARGLVTGGSTENLKNSTYDLTVGEIVPIGKEGMKLRRKKPNVSPYYLEPREMVWVLSKEEFNMPGDVTGLATLRTTYTKQGLLALNVGIIDPFFRGPVSTALINFSDRPRQIAVGDKFFRVAFFEHEDVQKHHSATENTNRADYVKQLEDVSYADFKPSFLNIPTFNDDFYAQKFWGIIWSGMWSNKKVFIPVAFVLAILGWFLVHLGFVEFLASKWDLLKGIGG